MTDYQGPPSINDIMRRRANEREHVIVTALLAATAGELPSSVATSVEFEIRQTVVPSRWDEDERIVIRAVRVEVSRSSISRDEADADGLVEVSGHGVRATSRGLPDLRGQWTWHSLPGALAAPLLLAAFTRTPILKDLS